jgi:hypothetical protein
MVYARAFALLQDAPFVRFNSPDNGLQSGKGESSFGQSEISNARRCLFVSYVARCLRASALLEEARYEELLQHGMEQSHINVLRKLRRRLDRLTIFDNTLETMISLRGRFFPASQREGSRIPHHWVCDDLIAVGFQLQSDEVLIAPPAYVVMNRRPDLTEREVFMLSPLLFLEWKRRAAPLLHAEMQIVSWFELHRDWVDSVSSLKLPCIEGLGTEPYMDEQQIDADWQTYPEECTEDQECYPSDAETDYVRQRWMGTSKRMCMCCSSWIGWWNSVHPGRIHWITPRSWGGSYADWMLPGMQASGYSTPQNINHSDFAVFVQRQLDHQVRRCLGEEECVIP